VQNFRITVMCKLSGTTELYVSCSRFVCEQNNSRKLQTALNENV